ncbi:MAG: asparagine synthase (glutamine-hydrolyzing), partial [Planctomycetota bacterium]
MCGILAVLESPQARGRTDRHAGRAGVLLERLAHRGPDGRGTRNGPRAWLGHRRLAIVDPEGGDQPFHLDGISWVVNGEIYNHESLRACCADEALPAADGAVIGPLWRRFGLAAVERLDGQFAFVAADERTGRWLAARDHVGICPLYLGRHADGTIWIASEMKALVDDCTHVEIIPPGHAWVYDGQRLRRVKWYDPPWQQPDALPDTPTRLETLRETLIEAVLERLMCDVPCGLLLSGGLDSSIIASIAVRYADRVSNLKRFSERFHTFSIGLEGAPDLAPAREVARFLGTIHHEFHFTLEEALAAVPHVVRHLESFEQIRTAVPTYLLARRVRETGIKMVLSGEGADEMFGGYLYFHEAPTPR